jgi:ribosomal protein S18 acetylase RimI-like enzyme
MAYVIKALAAHHIKASFKCGVPALDRYLQQNASQDIKRHVAATFVLTEEEDETVIGYYTLAAANIEINKLPTDMIKKLPKYPLLPATLLGHLAVNEQHRRKKLGELLLVDALKRALQLSNEIASMAMIVDAKNIDAVLFYKRYGFIQFADDENKLFLPMAIIKKIWNN